VQILACSEALANAEEEGESINSLRTKEEFIKITINS
jgi:hypothetical protein